MKAVIVVVSSAFLVVSCPIVFNPVFLCFPSATVPRSHVDEATNKPVPVSPSQANSSNCGSLDGSIPDLDALSALSISTVDERVNDVKGVIVVV